MRFKMIKRTAVLAAVIGSLCSWGSICAAEEPMPVPQMSYEDFPRIDGSLACVPMMEALAMKATGCSEAQAEEVTIPFQNTNPSYLALAEGSKDLLLVYEAAEETREQLKEYAPLDIRELGRDALVFLVNENNPVQSLTKEQIYDIYTGKITNWKEVGGEDVEIKAFLRPETSGSQTLMRKLILGDAELVEGQWDEIPTMEGIIEELREYENDANALGYSVYYYASNMHQVPGVRLISAEGSEPSPETISSGEYPFVNPFFVVTSESSPENALKLRDWLISEAGQDFVEECGYVRAE